MDLDFSAFLFRISRLFKVQYLGILDTLKVHYA